MFAMDHTEDICKLVNLTQTTAAPVVVVLADRLHALAEDLGSRIKNKTLLPRVVEALAKVKAEERTALQKKFWEAMTG